MCESRVFLSHPILYTLRRLRDREMNFQLPHMSMFNVYRFIQQGSRSNSGEYTAANTHLHLVEYHDDEIGDNGYV